MKKVTTFEESSCSGNPVTVFKAISDIQTLVELQGDAFQIGLMPYGTATFSPTMFQENWNVAPNEELDDNGEPTFNLWNDDGNGYFDLTGDEAIKHVTDILEGVGIIRSNDNYVIAEGYETIVELAETHKDRLNNANLEGEDLRDANLKDADLEEANLECAYLDDANLSNANLECANLRQAYLLDANLSNANLEYADLCAATLKGADLLKADLASSDLSGANLQDVDLRDADLCAATLKGANLRGANLSGANLTRANLEGTILDKNEDKSASSLKEIAGENREASEGLAQGTVEMNEHETR